MCKWGTETMLLVEIPAHLSSTGSARHAVKGIDSCVAGIVAALNAGGVKTISSCCGHGKEEGLILLADGRALVIRSRNQTTQSNGGETMNTFNYLLNCLTDDRMEWSYRARLFWSGFKYHVLGVRRRRTHEN